MEFSSVFIWGEAAARCAKETKIPRRFHTEKGAVTTHQQAVRVIMMVLEEERNCSSVIKVCLSLSAYPCWQDLPQSFRFLHWGVVPPLEMRGGRQWPQAGTWEIWSGAREKEKEKNVRGAECWERLPEKLRDLRRWRCSKWRWAALIYLAVLLSKAWN